MSPPGFFTVGFSSLLPLLECLQSTRREMDNPPVALPRHVLPLASFFAFYDNFPPGMNIPLPAFLPKNPRRWSPPLGTYGSLVGLSVLSHVYHDLNTFYGTPLLEKCLPPSFFPDPSRDRVWFKGRPVSATTGPSLTFFLRRLSFIAETSTDPPPMRVVTGREFLTPPFLRPPTTPRAFRG